MEEWKTGRLRSTGEGEVRKVAFDELRRVKLGMRKVESFDFGFGIVDCGRRKKGLKLKTESKGQRIESRRRKAEGGIIRG
jgi:hypothetical protein